MIASSLKMNVFSSSLSSAINPVSREKHRYIDVPSLILMMVLLLLTSWESPNWRVISSALTSPSTITRKVCKSSSKETYLTPGTCEYSDLLYNSDQKWRDKITVEVLKSESRVVESWFRNVHLNLRSFWYWESCKEHFIWDLTSKVRSLSDLDISLSLSQVDFCLSVGM